MPPSAVRFRLIHTKTSRIFTIEVQQGDKDAPWVKRGTLVLDIDLSPAQLWNWRNYVENSLNRGHWAPPAPEVLE